VATASTQTFELSIDSLCRRSFQLAGLLEARQLPSTDDLALAHDFLGMELDALQADGIVLRTVERTTLALTAGTAEYTLDGSTIDVYVDPSNVVGTIVPTTGNETLVRAMSRQEYLSISNKDTQTNPALVYVEKQGTTKVVFWPVPEVNCTFRYAKIRLPYDSSDGSKTMDLARRWQQAICYTIAWQLATAKSLPLDRVGFIRNTAEEMKARARMGDTEKTNIQMYVSRYY